jgi:hypothetical protein
MKTCALIIDNRPGLEPIIEAHEAFLPKDWEVYWIKDQNTSTAAGYNQLLTSRKLWRNLPADKVLIFQADSELLKDGVEQFIEWDYVGAPWRFQSAGGNGGLSIRSRKAMLKVIDSVAWDGKTNEDVYFCNALHQLGMNLAPREVCSQFSVESIYCEGTVGAHAIDKWLTPDQCKAIRNQYNVPHAATG